MKLIPSLFSGSSVGQVFSGALKSHAGIFKLGFLNALRKRMASFLIFSPALLRGRVRERAGCDLSTAC
jgi:hypothetical protein